MANKRALVLVVGVALGFGTTVVACSDDDTAPGPDASTDAPFIDGGSKDGSGDTGTVDTGAGDTGSGDTGPIPDAAQDTKPPDTTPPGSVTDLAATAETHVSVKLTWTAPPDEADAGTAAAYEIRYATTAITTEAEFLAAMAATPPAPAPKAAGSAETVTVTGLLPETQYHFAIRARDGVNNFGAISNDAVVTTKARATFLVTEIAPLNTVAEGDDFVELIATKAGSAADIEIRHSAGSPSAVLHKLAALDVVVGDRIVVHVAGLPGPTGFAQEDTTKDKTSSTATNASAVAYDVYSAVTGLVSTNSLIVVADGATFQDAVPYSSRAVDASTAAMTAFANAYAAAAWTFTAVPADGANDCPTLLEVVNGSGNTSPACGGYPGFLVAGQSFQRNGVVDTNTRADFFVAPQTPGLANPTFCAPEGAQIALTEVNPRANLVELTVVQGGNLRGFNLRQNPTAASTGSNLVLLPSFCPATGDIVVLHLADNASPSETTAKNEQLAATYPTYYDDAWDIASGNSTTVSFTTHVLAIRNPANVFIEAGVFSIGSGTPLAAYNDSLAFVQGLGLWLPADCNGMACTDATVPSARDLAASWAGLGTTAADSCRRTSAASARIAASWSVGASGFGQ